MNDSASTLDKASVHGSAGSVDQAGPSQGLHASKGRGRRRGRSLGADRWQALIVHQRRSGQSIATFCRDHDLGVATFYHWQRRLRDLGLLDSSAALRPRNGSPARSQPSPTAMRYDHDAGLHGGVPMPMAHHHASPSAVTGQFIRLEPIDSDDGSSPSAPGITPGIAPGMARTSDSGLTVRFDRGVTLHCPVSHLRELVSLLLPSGESR